MSIETCNVFYANNARYSHGNLLSACAHKAPGPLRFCACVNFAHAAIKVSPEYNSGPADLDCRVIASIVIMPTIFGCSCITLALFSLMQGIYADPHS